MWSLITQQIAPLRSTLKKKILMEPFKEYLLMLNALTQSMDTLHFIFRVTMTAMLKMKKKTDTICLFTKLKVFMMIGTLLIAIWIKLVCSKLDKTDSCAHIIETY